MSQTTFPRQSLRRWLLPLPLVKQHLDSVVVIDRELPGSPCLPFKRAVVFKETDPQGVVEVHCDRMRQRLESDEAAIGHAPLPVPKPMRLPTNSGISASRTSALLPSSALSGYSAPRMCSTGRSHGPTTGPPTSRGMCACSTIRRAKLYGCRSRTMTVGSIQSSRTISPVSRGLACPSF
jgi:hypothetical protein